MKNINLMFSKFFQRNVKFYGGIVVFICSFLGLGATDFAFSGKNSSQNSADANSQSGIAVNNSRYSTIRQKNIHISNRSQKHPCLNKRGGVIIVKKPKLTNEHFNNIKCQPENNVLIKKLNKQKKDNITIWEKVKVLSGSACKGVKGWVPSHEIHYRC